MGDVGVAEGDANFLRAWRSSPLRVDDYVAVDPPAKERDTARAYEQELAEQEDRQTAYTFDAKEDDQFSNSGSIFASILHYPTNEHAMRTSAG